MTTVEVAGGEDEVWLGAWVWVWEGVTAAWALAAGGGVAWAAPGVSSWVWGGAPGAAWVVLVGAWSGLVPNTWPRTWGLPVALVVDPESSVAKWPTANPPANTPMAMDPATIG